MKRLGMTIAMVIAVFLGGVSAATAQSNNEAIVILDCVAENRGEGTVIVQGGVVATFVAPAEGSNGLGPCKIPPGQVP